jgi:NAD(P)H-dependent flavin oxidoreductase YrpB (nitropropane dioxygenase family)
MIKTKLCELMGIKYPIIQAPMNWISGADLVAAVSKAGGLGTLGPNAGQKTISDDPAVVKQRLISQIHKVRSLTDKPFAVNIAASSNPQTRPFAEVFMEACVEEQVAAAMVIMGSPDMYTKRLQDAGVKVFHCITTPEQAIRAEKAGVEAIVTEGFEGGGHLGVEDLTTMTLVPLVASAVKIPVVAGGGIGDGRGFMAALSLGAEGVYMGTRFLATVESDANPKFKEAVVNGKGPCTVAHGVKMGGGLVRSLKNGFVKKYLEAELAGADVKELMTLYTDYRPEEKGGFASSGTYSRLYHAFVDGDMEQGVPAAGQVSGVINELKTAAQVIEDIMKEAQLISARFKSMGL